MSQAEKQHEDLYRQARDASLAYHLAHVRGDLQTRNAKRDEFQRLIAKLDKLGVAYP